MKNKRLYYIPVVLVALLAMAYGCKDTDNSKMDFERIDSLCARIFPENEPGGAVLILKGDDVVYCNCRGIANADTGTRITDTTLFNIASVSKQFTAVGILQLAEKNLLSLDDNVHKFFPEFSSNIWDRVQIKHLLSHSSGVPDGRGYLTREQKVFGDEDLATEYLKDLDALHFEPGTAYEYMNPTFVVLGKIIEKVSGLPYVEYMEKNVLGPAGMSSSHFFDPELMAGLPECSHGYVFIEGWKEYDYGEETFFATRPDGGLYTSVNDFVKWELALRSGKVLGQEMLALAHTPHTQVSGSTWSDYQNRPNTWYGYGWFIEPKTEAGKETEASPLVVYHTGDNGGYQILAARYPESDILVLIFANQYNWDRYSAKMEIQDALGL